jgi:hypothetical protein
MSVQYKKPIGTEPVFTCPLCAGPFIEHEREIGKPMVLECFVCHHLILVAVCGFSSAMRTVEPGDTLSAEQAEILRDLGWQEKSSDLS